jgi:hypothetical protein
MATYPTMAPGDTNEVQVPADVRAAKALAGLGSGAQSAALWCKPENPDPRSTISAMWASSIVWAAENLAAMLSTTVNNVKRSR